MSHDLINSLRAKIEEQRQEALKALEVLSRLLADPIGTQPVHANGEQHPRKQNQRQLVVDALRSHPKGLTTAQLVPLTGLSKEQVRGVLYAPAMKSVVKSVVVDGVATYSLKRDESP